MAKNLKQTIDQPLTCGLDTVTAKCCKSRLLAAMAMIVLSFTLFDASAGLSAQSLQSTGFSLVGIRDGAEAKAIRIRNWAVEHYENIRLVYRLASQLENLQVQPEDSDLQKQTGRCTDREPAKAQGK